MKVTPRYTSRAVVLAFVALASAACGGAIQSGVAIGKVGRGLSEHARVVPQGAEACGLQEAMQSGAAAEKPISESCAKAAKNDRVWRGSMVALAAYGEALEGVAAGTGAEGVGQVEAARTGIRGKDWADADGAAEQAARDAASALMAQLEANAGKGDLGKMVTDAAPHVKTLCDGLTSYLDAQARAMGDLSKEAEKKRATRQDRRCGAVDSRSVCVGESPIDRMVYGKVYAQAMLLEGANADARDAVAGFCAAHKKVEEAAAQGNLGNDKTRADIVEAVKGARKAKDAGGDKGADKGAPKAPPAKK